MELPELRIGLTARPTVGSSPPDRPRPAWTPPSTGPYLPRHLLIGSHDPILNFHKQGQAPMMCLTLALSALPTAALSMCVANASRRRRRRARLPRRLTDRMNGLRAA